MRTQSDYTIKAGRYRILRVDGTDELIEEAPTVEALRRHLNAKEFHTHHLGPNTLMVCDDEAGLHPIDRPDNMLATTKPDNPAASKIVYGDWPHKVFGDVAIINDADNWFF